MGKGRKKSDSEKNQLEIMSRNISKCKNLPEFYKNDWKFREICFEIRYIVSNIVKVVEKFVGNAYNVVKSTKMWENCRKLCKISFSKS